MQQARQKIAIVETTAVQPSTPRNADAKRLLRVVDALVSNDDSAAEAELAPIARITVDHQPLEAFPALPRSGWSAGTGARTCSAQRRPSLAC
jgi:hypothetical protein